MSSRRKYLTVLVLVVIVVCFTAAFTYVRDHSRPYQNDMPKVEKAQHDQEKKQYVESNTPIPSPTQTTPETNVSAENLTLSARQDNDSVVIIAQVKNLSQGNCTLLIKNADLTKEYTARLIYQPEYSTCEGFSIPIAAIGKGSWTISFSPLPNATKSITFEVK